MNKVLLLGNLGADPEMNNGVCKLRMATSRKYKNKDGDMVEDVAWHRVTAFGKTAELCSSYLSKGRSILVEGRLSYSKYEKDGNTVYSTDIIANNVQFLGGKDSNAKSSVSSSTDDEIPF